MNTFSFFLLLASMTFNIAMLFFMVKWAGRAKSQVASIQELNKKYIADIAYNKAKLNEVFYLLDTLNKVYSGQQAARGQNGRTEPARTH
jgi:hypothetical protein